MVPVEAAHYLHIRDRLFEAVLILEIPVVNTGQLATRFSAVESNGPAGVVVLVALVALVAGPPNRTLLLQVFITSELDEQRLRTLGRVNCDFELFFCQHEVVAILTGDFSSRILELGGGGGEEGGRDGRFFHLRERSPSASLVATAVEHITQREVVGVAILVVAEGA